MEKIKTYTKRKKSKIGSDDDEGSSINTLLESFKRTQENL